MEVGGITYTMPEVAYRATEASNNYDMLDVNQNERPVTVSVKNWKCDLLSNESDLLTVYDAEKQTSKLNMHSVNDVFLHLTSEVPDEGTVVCCLCCNLFARFDSFDCPLKMTISELDK